MPHDSKHTATCCPICAKTETLHTQDLVCKDCVNSGVEIIKNSVARNEELNMGMRAEINSIFEACLHYQNGQSLSDLRQRHTDDKHIPNVTTDSVKNLAIQLQKLAIANTKIKINGIQMAEDAMRTKVQRTMANIEKTQKRIDDINKLLDTKVAELAAVFNKQTRSLETETQQIYDQSIDQTMRYSAAVQRKHYKVLRDIALPNYDQWRLSVSSISRRKNVKLLLFGSPVIQLSSFLTFNNKLTEINSFIENLIRFQIELQALLSQNDNSVNLPFLEDLIPLLPNSSFYDLVQEKINFVTKDGKPTTPSPTLEENEDISPKSSKFSVSTDRSIDKIVIEGNVIKIPISFKTINLQRRTSLMSPEPANSISEPVNVDKYSPSFGSYSFQPKSPSPLSESTQQKLALKGKKIVITPHKILTKPFTRLKPKEYLKFISVVVKILINFDVLLKITADRAPGNNLKKQASSGTLGSTFHQLRASGNHYQERLFNMSDREGEDTIYDFEKILSKLANLEPYFHSRSTLQKAKPSKDPSSIASSLTNISSSPSSLRFNTSNSESFPSSEFSASIVNVVASQVSSKKKPSRLKELYDTVFNRQTSAVAPTQAENIYGMVSETNSHTDVSKSKVSERSPIIATPETFTDTSTYEQTLGAANGQNYNVKKVMQDVHKILASGFGNSRSKAIKKVGIDNEVKKATLSMMSQSKAQLEDWNVVSTMYK
ncbi:hypothetical protein EJF18_10753 [Clavispora lusitaniae]|uniref:Uncharacterized protein n=1 Tax=Clavispora lusitaniae TaxID=36911 RepID=A0ACD0WDU9_CLALS|nr:hypothetical protein EJF14_10753 [Clavispora lusitaniae]QFZ31047.1 hypothetical protein EJF16_10753 [Clavispora lusitaniae]QFZ36715.1 hypothetical protein EJF15_10753 [Clavispora lusitaniae]QFZ42399.1 hypothetical protein EJF18_10753 [Clavispora lusitaniae]QFZ48075.1 hypothetical protein EJF17_10753 [Clavispora lusitaniae]